MRTVLTSVILHHTRVFGREAGMKVQYIGSIYLSQENGTTSGSSLTTPEPQPAFSSTAPLTKCMDRWDTDECMDKWGANESVDRWGTNECDRSPLAMMPEAVTSCTSRHIKRVKRRAGLC